MLQAFGIHWVMPRSVEGLLSCWHQWLGKHYSNIWNLILGCLMWVVCLERNRRSFENMEKTLDELKVLWQRSLFEWAHCWALLILRLFQSFWFPLVYLSNCLFFCFVVCFFCFFLFIIMNNLYFSFFHINNSSQVTYQKKTRHFYQTFSRFISIPLDTTPIHWANFLNSLFARYLVGTSNIFCRRHLLDTSR